MSQIVTRDDVITEMSRSDEVLTQVALFVSENINETPMFFFGIVFLGLLLFILSPKKNVVVLIAVFVISYFTMLLFTSWAHNIFMDYWDMLDLNSTV